MNYIRTKDLLPQDLSGNIQSSLLDNVFQDLKAEMSDDSNLCFLSQPQATGDTDRALFFKLLTKLKEEKLTFSLVARRGETKNTFILTPT